MLPATAGAPDAGTASVAVKKTSFKSKLARESFPAAGRPKIVAAKTNTLLSRNRKRRPFLTPAVASQDAQRHLALTPFACSAWRNNSRLVIR
jgi:hypothetical protein